MPKCILLNCVFFYCLHFGLPKEEKDIYDELLLPIGDENETYSPESEGSYEMEGNEKMTHIGLPNEEEKSDDDFLVDEEESCSVRDESYVSETDEEVQSKKVIIVDRTNKKMRRMSNDVDDESGASDGRSAGLYSKEVIIEGRKNKRHDACAFCGKSVLSSSFLRHRKNS